MPRHWLKLAALAAVFFVAPAGADHLTTAKAMPRHSDCPHKSAQTVAPWGNAGRTVKGATTITLTEPVSEGSLFDLGWRPRLLTP